MRFLVDENLPAAIAGILRTRGHDVLHISASEHRGASDQELWSLAADEARILMTRDLDFPLPQAPAPPGLVLIRVPDTYTGSQIAEMVSGFAASEAAGESEGAITVLSPGRVRSRPI